MNNKEIIEYLAVNLFYLEKGVDFDECHPAPDYISDYRLVLAWLCAAKDSSEVYLHKISTDKCRCGLLYSEYNEEFNIPVSEYFEAISETLGEAICRVAVRLLKKLENNSCTLFKEDVKIEK